MHYSKKFPTIIRQLFNEDQIELLTKKYKKVIKWCDATLVKAYHLKFTCGVSGREWKTLNRKLEKSKFRSGILYKMYELLRIKVSQFNNSKDKDCVIILDEISISSVVFLDTSTFTGNNRTGKIADHALVFMLRGLKSDWRIPISYNFCSKQTNTAQLNHCIHMHINIQGLQKV
ncbi:hypothetical protein ALC57_05973 [Trachymyrmex cornetzi]|uniref:Transposable element P transposase-like RNase H domain-containing protein n=1 Tax=Trachymyrmex cornetzi TaxID=471704 RepID=A0A151J9A7_9HYME|nr:hypothetical protein ALC57_05973 [Trachymyrmex cornetzi]